jgi:hypothetical protein
MTAVAFAGIVVSGRLLALVALVVVVVVVAVAYLVMRRGA